MAVYTPPMHSKNGWSFIQHAAAVNASPNQWEMAPFRVNSALEQQQAAHIVIKELMRYFSMMENDSYYDQTLGYTNNYVVNARPTLTHKYPGWRYINDNYVPASGSDFDWEAPSNPTNWNGESFDVLVGVNSTGGGVFITYAQQKSSVYGQPSMYVGVNTSASLNAGFVNGGAMPIPSNIFQPSPYTRNSNTLFTFSTTTPMIIPLISTFSVNERQS
jgi:hypothetical protein